MKSRISGCARMRPACTLACAALLLSACASTGVVGMDGDTLMLHKKSMQVGFGSPDGAVADVYREAGAHCAARGMTVQTLALDRETVLPVRPGSATLRFRCVARREGGTGVPATAAGPALGASAVLP